MVIYNTTNLTASNTVFDVTTSVNQLANGNIGNLMLAGFVILLFLMMGTRFRFSSSLAASTFSGSILASLMTPVGLISDFTLIIMIVITVASFGYLWWED